MTLMMFTTIWYDYYLQMIATWRLFDCKLFATFVLDICRGKLLDATFWVLKRQVHCNNRFWFFRPCYVPIICERTLFAGDAPNHVRDTSSRPVGSRLGQICLATLSKKSSFDLCFSYCRHCKVELIIGCLKKNIPGEGYCHVVLLDSLVLLVAIPCCCI